MVYGQTHFPPLNGTSSFGSPVKLLRLMLRFFRPSRPTCRRGFRAYEPIRAGCQACPSNSARPREARNPRAGRRGFPRRGFQRHFWTPRPPPTPTLRRCHRLTCSSSALALLLLSLFVSLCTHCYCKPSTAILIRSPSSPPHCPTFLHRRLLFSYPTIYPV